MQSFRLIRTMSKFTYPSAARSTVLENHFGRDIADPYRWLEDPDAPETVSFVKDQNTATQHFLEQSKIRPKFEKKMTQLMNYERFGCPMKRGDAYYYFHNSGYIYY